jgi:predicted peptidase
VALIVAAATVAISPVSADTRLLDRATQFNGETYRYQVYVPLKWTNAQKWPVVLYLHGNGNQGDGGSLQLETTGISVAIRQQRKRFPMIVVSPSPP